MKKVAILGLVATAAFALIALSAYAGGSGGCSGFYEETASITVAKALTPEDAKGLMEGYLETTMPNTTISPLIEFVNFYSTDVLSEGGEVIGELSIDKITHELHLSI